MKYDEHWTFDGVPLMLMATEHSEMLAIDTKMRYQLIVHSQLAMATMDNAEFLGFGNWQIAIHHRLPSPIWEDSSYGQMGWFIWYILIDSVVARYMMGRQLLA